MEIDVSRKNRFDLKFRSIRKSTKYNVVSNDVKIVKYTFKRRFLKFELNV